MEQGFSSIQTEKSAMLDQKMGWPIAMPTDMRQLHEDRTPYTMAATDTEGEGQFPLKH